MNQNKIIGIITFHAAHNYGSVLQAYATQQLIKGMGYENEIINYRLPNQRQFYNNLYSYKFGAKDFLRRIMKLPEHKKRVERKKKFENFISGKLVLSEKEYKAYDQLMGLHDRYDAIITGSDQVWNKHCKAEFKTEPEESILGYYLNWADDDVVRISFSSSFGGMKREEISAYSQMLAKYSALSVREADGAQMLSDLLDGRSVENTLDPTLLLSPAQWSELCKGNSFSGTRQYVLVYTLRQYNAAKILLEPVKELSKRFGLEIKVIAPFSLTCDAMAQSVIDSGPEDFIALIRDASLVVTDSFHGTAFSINMGTPFYVIEHSKDNRKGLLLKRLGLQDRALTSCDELLNINDFSCDFSAATRFLGLEREKSIKWLNDRLEDFYGD